MMGVYELSGRVTFTSRTLGNGTERPNFGVKLMRPGFDPAAEQPASSLA